MTIEEMAVSIQNGQTELYTELWERLHGIIHTQCSKYYRVSVERFEKLGLEYDDLVQECYFALIDAVKAYDREKGYKFTTYLNYPIKNRFNALIFNRTALQKRTIQVGTVSLETPVKDSEDTTLQDTIEDERVAFQFETVEEQDWNERLHDILWEGLADLPHTQHQVIIHRYYDGMDTKQIAEHMGIHDKEVRSLEKKGLWSLRRNGRIYRRLQPYYEEIKTPVRDCYSIKQSGRISSTERNALLLDVLGL